jgi:ubiquinone/menaquinone biosynthesis C-methylase UbiE
MIDHPPGFFEGTEMPNTGWWEALWPAPAEVLQAVGLAQDMDVVDLCSGDGWFTLQIAKIARAVFAIDIDEKLLKVARTRLIESNVTNCTFIVGDAYRLPAYVTEPIDFVSLANAFHGVPDKVRLARAVYDVLKPGGGFAIVRVRKLSCWGNQEVHTLNCGCHQIKPLQPSSWRG